MDITLVLNCLEQVELAMASFYQWLSGVFSDDEEVAALFLRMRTDERAHCNMIRYQRRLVVNNPTLFVGVALDMDEIRMSIQAVEQLRDSEETPSLEEALLASIAFEGDTAEWHHRSAITESNPDLKMLISALGRSDVTHRTALILFAEGRGVSVPDDDFFE